MAVSPIVRATACAWPSRLQLLCGAASAALLALNIDAVRLDQGTVSSDGANVGELSSRASIPSALAPTAARAQRDRDLLTAERYLGSINDVDSHHLGNVKDILERLENIRERVLSFGAARDARHRLQIRNILRDVRERGEALKVLAGKLEAVGQVDDGGDELPTQRDNIGSRINECNVDSAFLGLVQLFCESLDGVREAVNSGEDEEPTAYAVSGLVVVIILKPDYRQGRIGREIKQLLGEERRWVAKQRVPRPAGTGNSLPSSEGADRRFRTWSLRAWEIQMWADAEVDTAALPFEALRAAHDVLVNATVEDDLTLSSVLTRITRIEFYKGKLAHFISRSDPAFHEQVREVLQRMKSRTDALHALAARKRAAGEVDNSGDLMPSQRDNICTKLDASGLEEDFRQDVRKLCEAFDRLRNIVKMKLETGKCIYEVLGRMTAIKHRPGNFDSPVVFELESLLAEEWSWLEQQEAFD